MGHNGDARQEALPYGEHSHTRHCHNTERVNVPMAIAMGVLFLYLLSSLTEMQNNGPPNAFGRTLMAMAVYVADLHGALTFRRGSGIAFKPSRSPVHAASSDTLRVHGLVV